MEQEKSFIKAKDKMVRTMDRKKLELIIGVVIIAAMVLLYLSTFHKSPLDGLDTSLSAMSEYSYVEEERRLKEILGRISGVGDVDVMITYAGGSELVPAYNSDVTVQSTDETNPSGTVRTTRNETESLKPVTEQDGTVLLSEKRPEVIGVIIVAEGAGDVEVCMALQRAAQAALNVPVSKVEVFEMSN
ncbi:MAG: hypothetical protein E7328_02000 [Clostridiales bacterium]|nr:hypothetical protein [Clostridiales bacterium]